MPSGHSSHFLPLLFDKHWHFPVYWSQTDLSTVPVGSHSHGIKHPWALSIFQYPGKHWSHLRPITFGKHLQLPVTRSQLLWQLLSVPFLLQLHAFIKKIRNNLRK